jgi:hypothetical protein
MSYDMNQHITPEFAAAYTQAVARTTAVMADAENPFHKNTYATLGAHIDATKGIFAQHGLSIVQFPCGDGENVGIETIVLHKDGGFIARKTFIKIPDNFKGQDAGSLFSYLRRYAIAAVANVATSDDDGEADRIVRSAPAAKAPAVVTKVIMNTPAPAPAPKAEAPKKQVAAPTGGLADALAFVVPFGKNKGVTLGQLPDNSLQWYIKEYQPKPYNGAISEKDKAFRDALDLIRDSRQASQDDSFTDNVPF